MLGKCGYLFLFCSLREREEDEVQRQFLIKDAKEFVFLSFLPKKEQRKLSKIKIKNSKESEEN